MNIRQRTVRHGLLLALIFTSSVSAFADLPHFDQQVKARTIVSFSEDQPDMVWVVSYKGVLYGVEDAPKQILPKLGWDDPDTRKELALAWVTGIELAGLLPLEDGNFIMAPRDATAPRVAQKDDGSVEIEIWAQMPRYRGPYFHRIYVFDAEANLTRTQLPVTAEPHWKPEKPRTWFWER